MITAYSTIAAKKVGWVRECAFRSNFHMVMDGLDGRMLCAALQVAESLAEAHLTHDIEREEHRPIDIINGIACATVHLSHGQVGFGFDTGFVAR